LARTRALIWNIQDIAQVPNGPLPTRNAILEQMSAFFRTRFPSSEPMEPKFVGEAKRQVREIVRTNGERAIRKDLDKIRADPEGEGFIVDPQELERLGYAVQGTCRAYYGETCLIYWFVEKFSPR
jgi:hypothetical protein